MRFRVDGADSVNGQDRSIAIEAGSAQEAEIIARTKGILSAGQPVPDAPTYDGIVNGSGIVRVIGGVLIGLGCLCFFAAFVCFILASNGEDDPTLLWRAGIACCISAVFYIGGGALFQLIAAMAMAVRDMARNGFNRPPAAIPPPRDIKPPAPKSPAPLQRS